MLREGEAPATTEPFPTLASAHRTSLQGGTYHVLIPQHTSFILRADMEGQGRSTGSMKRFGTQASSYFHCLRN